MDYDIDDLECPHCGHNTRSRSCSEITCTDGSIDESDEYFLIPGSRMVLCDTCKGSGIERWCPKCGKDLSGVRLCNEDDTDY